MPRTFAGLVHRTLWILARAALPTFALLIACCASAAAQSNAIVAWGDNSYGQATVPALPPGLTYVEVAAGGYHTVARRSDGSVVAWGHNGSGQTDVPPLPPGLTYVEVSAGWFHSASGNRKLTHPTIES